MYVVTSYKPEGQTMSNPRRLRFAKQFHHSIVFTMGILFLASAASAGGPSLWLYPEDAGPREGGHVVPPGYFILVIENIAHGSGDATAYDVQLVIAVENRGAVSSLSLDGTEIPLEDDGWEEGTPPLPCSGKPMPRHGVFPTTYTTIDLGILEGNKSFLVDVDVAGDEDLRVHFDAMARGMKTAGREERCFDVSNPAGHDVTVANRRGGQDSCGRISITKTADPSAINFGQKVLFTIEVQNEGTCELTELLVKDHVPAVEGEDGTEHPAFRPFDDAVPPYRSDDGLLLEWPIDDPLPVGEPWIIEFEAVFDELLADQRKLVNRACVSAAELHKKHCAAAVVTVGNPYGDDGPAGPGFWCHATRWLIEGRPKVPVDEEDFMTWLGMVDDSSQVFTEGGLHQVYFEGDPEASFAAAADLVCTPQFAEGAADRLARHLLVLWLNVKSGRIDDGQTLGGLCIGDEILPDDADLEMTVGQVLVDAEADLMAEADDGQLTFWSEVIDAINNSYVAGEGQCADRRTVSSRHRAGTGRPHGKSTASTTKN
jgi:uncharacterized repeat protein (TIGR01451 family)